MPLQATSGAASYDAFGGGAPAAAPNYIEDVFSTYLYTGTGASQTITNGVDLSGKGGMVWLKTRNVAGSNYVQDTARGATQSIYTNSTAASGTANILSSFTSSGFVDNNQFSNGDTIASWTFRKQPKFFDIVTYSGNSTAGNTVSHNLGSVPGTIIVKITSGTGSWFVYHRSLGATKYILLDDTGAAGTSGGIWNNTEPTSSVFTLGNDGSVNSSGQTYVAYLFAHNAGGFGLTGTDNVISCGSFTTNGAGSATVTLGYEPQWAIWKRTDSTSAWNMVDNMRGWGVTNGQLLSANTSNAESANNPAPLIPNATGFSVEASASATYIYIAIRRGPMKVPTSGTSVYNGITRTGTGAATNITGAGFPIDLLIQHERATSNNIWTTDRLRATLSNLDTQSTAAENTNSFFQFDKQDGFGLVGAAANVSGRTMIDWVFRRAPSVFDVVCYTGTGVDLTVNHNLGVVPEWVIIKNRSRGGNWSGAYFANASEYYDLRINQDIGRSLITMGPLGPTLISNSATTFGVYGGSTLVNYSGDTYVAYLFATCAGVSKVGSYTGTATTKQIDCGFTGGARFVLIKRTDSTGDWYVWDTARGIVSGNDPYVLLNSANVEVTSTDYIDTYSAGFEISSTAPAAINASGGSYIFLAIA